MKLKDLARQLNLSPTTVSRALNGYPEVSETTRRRVERAARRANYRPSLHARHLASGRSNVIGHVIARSRRRALGPHFADFMTGAGEAASRLGYDSLLSLVDDSSAQSMYRDLMLHGRVDAVVLHGPAPDDPCIRLLQTMSLPFMVHGRSDGIAGDYAWLDVDNRCATRRATDLLLDLGHRDIVLLNGELSFNFAVRRRAGYIEAFSRRGIAPRADRVYHAYLTEGFGFDVLSQLLDHPTDRPTAVVCSSILPAFGALRAAISRQLEIGRDLSIVTFDDQPSWLGNGTNVPLFTAVRSSIEQAGARLIELLVHRLTNPQSALPTELLEAELVIGRSIGPPSPP